METASGFYDWLALALVWVWVLVLFALYFAAWADWFGNH